MSDASFSGGEKKENLMLAERASEDDNMIFSERMLDETSLRGARAVALKGHMFRMK
jgi:hypothetical protein